MAPSVIVVAMSFSESRYLAFPPHELGVSWYINFLASRDWLTALWVSVRVATSTAVLATVTGTIAALAIYGKTGAFERACGAS
jgi:ABC-type spermidine/putrescine transport system permease subunit II